MVPGRVFSCFFDGLFMGFPCFFLFFSPCSGLLKWSVFELRCLSSSAPASAHQPTPSVASRLPRPPRGSPDVGPQAVAIEPSWPWAEDRPRGALAGGAAVAAAGEPVKLSGQVLAAYGQRPPQAGGGVAADEVHVAAGDRGTESAHPCALASVACRSKGPCGGPRARATLAQAHRGLRQAALHLHLGRGVEQLL